MRRFLPLFLLSAAAVAVSPSAVLPRTEVRDGPPRVVFESLRLPESVSWGDIFVADISFRLTAPVDEDLKVFFHLVRPGQDRSSLNADFYPRIPAGDWVVGQIMPAGPFNLAIPRGLEPGEYDVRAGLMEIVREEDVVRFVREPYANEEITGFIVGSITIEEVEEEELDLPETVDLVDYEVDEDIIFWEPFNASLEPHENGVLVTLHPGVEYPAVVLENIFRLKPLFSDWSYFDLFELGVGMAPGARPANIKLQITDRGGRRFQERLTVGADEILREFSTVRLSGRIDLSRIASVKLFAFRPENDVSFLITRTRLIARDPVDEKAAVTFVRLEGPERVERGELFRFRLVFRLNQPIYPDHKLFVHLYREHDLAGRVGTDIALSPAIRFWPIESEVAVQSAPLLISPNAPPGNYVVRAGLYMVVPAAGEPYVKMAEWESYEGEEAVPHVIQPTAPVDYFKQPYTNPEIREWEVGRITVE